MKPVLKCGIVTSSVVVTVVGGLLAAVGVVVKFRTEMIDGYLTPLVKLLPSGSGTGADVWTLYDKTAIALIGFGAATCITGVLGCWVGMSPRTIPVVTYMVVSTILMCSLITSSALILTMDMKKDMTDTLWKNLYSHYRGDKSSSFYSEAWNYAFVEFSCCGAKSYTDLLNTLQWDRTETDENGTVYTVKVPVTCCKLPGKYPDYGDPYNATCTTDPTSSNSHRNQNCSDKLYDYLWYYGVLMSCSCIGVVFFEGVSMVIVVLMCVELKRKRTRIKQALIAEGVDY